jgi:hypothetical protein
MFVLQVALGELALPSDWPGDEQVWAHRGALLRFFAPQNFEPWDEPRVTAIAPSRDLRRRPAPAGTQLLPERTIELQLIATLRDAHPSVSSYEDQTSVDSYALDDWSFVQDETREGHRHHLLGWPRCVQHDPLESAEYQSGTARHGTHWPSGADWRLLLALHWDDQNGLEILDGGAAYFVLRAEDLAAGRYDRVTYIAESC